MKRVLTVLMLCVGIAWNSHSAAAFRGSQADRIERLIRSLNSHPWAGVEISAEPMMWDFNPTEPMQPLLEIGPDAQEPLIGKLPDAAIVDHVIFLLGGVGDERAVGPIIAPMQTASRYFGAKRRRILIAGNVALTNITVADVIWHHGGGIVVYAQLSRRSGGVLERLVAAAQEDPPRGWHYSGTPQQQLPELRHLSRAPVGPDLRFLTTGWTGAAHVLLVGRQVGRAPAGQALSFAALETTGVKCHDCLCPPRVIGQSLGASETKLPLLRLNRQENRRRDTNVQAG